MRTFPQFAAPYSLELDCSILIDPQITRKFYPYDWGCKIRHIMLTLKINFDVPLLRLGSSAVGLLRITHYLLIRTRPSRLLNR